MGAFYTGSAATESMARWAVRSPGDRLLEPSFGDGSFLRAVNKVAGERRLARVAQFGAELVKEPFDAALKAKLIVPRNAFLGDFLALQPFEVDAVIGNPPYVRLRHLPQQQQRQAVRVASQVLGAPMETSGSIWMPFVLHCLRFLRTGGRLALVLPHEITHVRYARPLWQKLGRCFATLRVVRVHERLFPDILQEVVLLFADGYGGSTRTIHFQSHEHAREFSESTDDNCVSLNIADICEGKRVFVRALLPPSTQSLLEDVLSSSTSPMTSSCVFNIGYVTGDKGFFHPCPATAKTYGLRADSLRPCLTSSRQLAACGLWTSNPTRANELLFSPKANGWGRAAGVSRYIEAGESNGIHNRYKCSVREPWYVVPGVRVPDVVLSVFAERPVLVVNDAELVASNSLLCGYLRDGKPEDFAAVWYTSLTLLQCELQVHSLGGGVFVLVPGEVASLRLPRCRGGASHLGLVDRHLVARRAEAAYGCGDEPVLRKQIGLRKKDIVEIREGIDLLRHWRTSSRGGLRNARMAIDA